MFSSLYSHRKNSRNTRRPPEKIVPQDFRCWMHRVMKSPFFQKSHVSWASSVRIVGLSCDEKCSSIQRWWTSVQKCSEMIDSPKLAISRSKDSDHAWISLKVKELKTFEVLLFDCWNRETGKKHDFDISTRIDNDFIRAFCFCKVPTLQKHTNIFLPK